MCSVVVLDKDNIFDLAAVDPAYAQATGVTRLRTTQSACTDDRWEKTHTFSRRRDERKVIQESTG